MSAPRTRGQIDLIQNKQRTHLEMCISDEGNNTWRSN